MIRDNPVESIKENLRAGAFDGLHHVTMPELPAVAEILADAFQNDAFNVYLFPDADARHKAFRIIYGTMLRLMLHTGEIHATSEKLEGVIVIGLSRKKGDKGDNTRRMRNDARHMGNNARHMGMRRISGMIRGILNALAMPFRISRVTKIGELLRRSGKVSWSYKKLHDSYKRYEPDLPYLSLDFIAVRPELQGNGWMGRMMRPLLEEARDHGRIVVLNTETPDNVPIYEHYGFTVDERIEVFPETLEYKVMSWRPKG
jgi:GNAT superfamily N-acetyltransferase